jgi:hypothetical protein
MIDHPIPISKVYVVLNKVLNNLVRKKFGKHYFIRLNSLTFINNRTNMNYFPTCSERFNLIFVKPVSIDELIIIKEFILFNINSALLCIDSENYKEVKDIEIVIKI